MIAAREAGQSQASAEAFALRLAAADQASEARSAVITLNLQLRKARAAAKEAAEEAHRALVAYEAIPYAEEG